MSEEDTAPQPPRPGLLGRLAGDVGNAALSTVDANLIAQQIDIDELVARVDVNDLLDRVEVNDLLDRVDVDRLLDQVDVDRLLERVDIDRLLERADIERIAQRANTGLLGGEGILDVVRSQVAGIDTVVTRTLRRLLGRSSGEDLSGDPADLTGDPAGLVSRVLAAAIDVAASLMIFTVLALLAGTALGAVLGRDGSFGAPQGPWFVGLAVLFSFLWTATTLASLGRTPGMLLVGLSVRSTREEERVHATQALLRTTVQALGSVLLGLGLLPVLIDGRRRAVEDIVADTELIHDWGRRTPHVADALGSYLAGD